MKKKIQIITTLGPSSLNAAFLKFSNNNIDLLRLNMSHIEPEELEEKLSLLESLLKLIFASIPRVHKSELKFLNLEI